MLSNNFANNNKKDLTNGKAGTYTIWQRLEAKAESISYGTICCEIQVHNGQIRQLDITAIKERFRID